MSEFSGVTAVLVGVQIPSMTDQEFQVSLDELKKLVETLGFKVLGTVTQRRDSPAAAAVLGEGKLKELATWTGGTGSVHPLSKSHEQTKQAAEIAVREDEIIHSEKAKYVIVDEEISPSQARNLEKATSAQVLDRTGVIVEIFHRHARSREAKLQVEIARLKYVAPRLRESPNRGDRQRGGIGGKGAGESELELDRRKIRDRIAELRHELEAIQHEQANRRQARRDQRRVALVGYTNAGKSSLMRALTGSDVLVANKLFATLDTTVRALYPETKPRLLVSDTVGFIKKLPHDLVASFRSTLDEALEASLILHVVDASDVSFRSQIQVTSDVLIEIGAEQVPHKLVFNKVDQLDANTLTELQLEFTNALFISAYSQKDIVLLRQSILEFFEASMIEEEIFVPYNKQNVVHEIYENGRVITIEHLEQGTQLRVKMNATMLAQIKSKI